MAITSGNQTQQSSIHHLCMDNRNHSYSNLGLVPGFPIATIDYQRALRAYQHTNHTPIIAVSQFDTLPDSNPFFSFTMLALHPAVNPIINLRLGMKKSPISSHPWGHGTGCDETPGASACRRCVSPPGLPEGL